MSFDHYGVLRKRLTSAPLSAVCLLLILSTLIADTQARGDVILEIVHDGSKIVTLVDKDNGHGSFAGGLNTGQMKFENFFTNTLSTGSTVTGTAGTIRDGAGIAFGGVNPIGNLAAVVGTKDLLSATTHKFFHTVEVFTDLGNPIGVPPGTSGVGPVYSSWTGVFSTPNATGNILVGSAIIGQWQSTLSSAAVPEPSSLLLLGCGTAWYFRRRRGKLLNA